MFFIMGVSPRKEELPYNQMVICSHCGSYGRYQVYMTYMCLSLFFLPVFKWDRHYYVTTSCCGTTYELDPEVGAAIRRGREVEILPEHLTMLQSGYRTRGKRCSSCGYETEEDFTYCPKCGTKL